MKSFQMNLPGYDSSRDDTEHLVLWVNAPRKTAAKLFARSIMAEIESVEEITYKEEEGIDYWVDMKGNITWIGKDVLDRQGGTCLCGHFDRCTHYKGYEPKMENKMYCYRCGLPMSYQEFEDEDGENFQWVCDGPNNNTKKKGCWNFVDLKGPLEFEGTSSEQLIDRLIDTSKTHGHYKDQTIVCIIEDCRAEILRRMKWEPINGGL